MNIFRKNELEKILYVIFFCLFIIIICPFHMEVKKNKQQSALINSILQSENKIFKTKSQKNIESFQIARSIYYILSKSGAPFQVSYRPSTTPTGGLSTDSIHMYGCDAFEREHHYQRQRPLSNNPIWHLEPSLCGSSLDSS